MVLLPGAAQQSIISAYLFFIFLNNKYAGSALDLLCTIKVLPFIYSGFAAKYYE